MMVVIRVVTFMWQKRQTILALQKIVPTMRMWKLDCTKTILKNQWDKIRLFCDL